MTCTPEVMKVSQNFSETGKLTVETGNTVVVVDGSPQMYWWRVQSLNTYNIGEVPR